MSRSKTRVVPTILIVLLSCISSPAQTQAPISRDACRAYQQAEAGMNKVFTQILSEYRRKPAFIQKLRAAQRSWLRFRDGHLDSLYPARNKATEFGSVYAMCRCMVLGELTKQRTQQLEKWITGLEEEDVCSGSIRIKR